MSEEIKEVQGDPTSTPIAVEKVYTSGEIIEGKVTGITSFGAFIKLPDGTEGLVHISEIANTYVTNVENFLKLGQDVTIKVLGKNQKGKYDLSIKQVAPKASGPVPYQPRSYGGGGGGGDRKKDKNYEPGSFEDIMHGFMKNSEDIQLDVRRNLQYRQGVKKKGKKRKADEE